MQPARFKLTRIWVGLQASQVMVFGHLCSDPDHKTKVSYGDSDSHNLHVLCCATRPAWPSGCVVLPVAHDHRINPAGGL